MLVQFSFKNWGSFKEETIFDMRAINAYKEHDYNLIKDRKYKLLKTALIYGANASGKTKFIEAFSSFRTIVVKSFSNDDVKGRNELLSQYFNPFKLSEKENNHIEYEIVFLHDNFEYQYGFIHNDKRILHEWLFRKENKPYSKKEEVFNRTEDDIFFNSYFANSYDSFKNSVRHDVLLISFYDKIKIDENIFQKIYNYIFNIRVFLESEINDAEEDIPFFLQILNDLPIEKESSGFRRKFLDYLKSIDFNIVDFEVKKNDNKYNVIFKHAGDNGKLFDLPLADESNGTRKMMALFLFFSLAMAEGFPIIIDEMDSKLHPLLVKYIVDAFQSSNSQGQIIATTHNTFLLDKKYLRRDQIWFVERNGHGCSELFSLAEFKARNDASFEKDYLAGVYGGIPILQDFEFITK